MILISRISSFGGRVISQKCISHKMHLFSLPYLILKIKQILLSILKILDIIHIFIPILYVGKLRFRQFSHLTEITLLVWHPRPGSLAPESLLSTTRGHCPWMGNSCSMLSRYKCTLRSEPVNSKVRLEQVIHSILPCGMSCRDPT